MRSPSAPRLPPQIFIFGSSRIFRNFCARALFSSRLALAYTLFLKHFLKYLNRSLSAVCYPALSDFLVSVCYILVYLYSFFVYVYYLFVLSCRVFIPLSFLVFYSVISCLPFCVARLFFCSLLLFLKVLLPRFSLFSSTFYIYIIHPFLISAYPFSPITLSSRFKACSTILLSSWSLPSSFTFSISEGSVSSSNRSCSSSLLLRVTS